MAQLRGAPLTPPLARRGRRLTAAASSPLQARGRMAGQTGKLEVNLLQGVKLRDTQTFGEAPRPVGQASSGGLQGKQLPLLGSARCCDPQRRCTCPSLVPFAQASKTHMSCSRWVTEHGCAACKPLDVVPPAHVDPLLPPIPLRMVHWMLLHPNPTTHAVPILRRPTDRHTASALARRQGWRHQAGAWHICLQAPRAAALRRAQLKGRHDKKYRCPALL